MWLKYLCAAFLFFLSMNPARAGFSLIYSTDFSKSDALSAFLLYGGFASATKNCAFDPDFNVLDWRHNHVLIMNLKHKTRTIWNGNTYPYSSSGWTLKPSLIHGAWEIRVSMACARGVTTYIALYPEDGSWPPEIDFAEGWGNDLNSMSVTQHYDSDNKFIQNTIPVANIADYHTYRLEWTPGVLKYYVDGSLKATQSQKIPSIKMRLCAGTWSSDGANRPIDRQLPTCARIEYIRIYKFEQPQGNAKVDRKSGLKQ